jgi:hypothetical protein
MLATNEIYTRLHGIEGHIDGHVRWILDTAAACPPGGNGSWDKVLAHYGASPDPALKRLEDAQQAGQSRGATLLEVRRALEAMLAQAKAELDKVVPPVAIGLGAGTNDVNLEGRVATLRARLTSIPDEAGARYAQTVCPPKAAVAASVNSVFANAQATAKLTPWANYKLDPAKVLSCHSCGAPQEVALDFVCRYCKSPMIKT